MKRRLFNLAAGLSLLLRGLLFTLLFALPLVAGIICTLGLVKPYQHTSFGRDHVGETRFVWRISQRTLTAQLSTGLGDASRAEFSFRAIPGLAIYRELFAGPYKSGGDVNLGFQLSGWWMLLLSVPLFLLARALANKLVPIRGPLGICERCGYDLRATPDRCPECGTSVAAKPAEAA
jgi:hypothetical protein